MLACPSNAETESCEELRYQIRNLTFLTNSHASQLNRGVCDFIDASPTIQYRIEPFAASLIGDSWKTFGCGSRPPCPAGAISFEMG